jgi:hypothetical protein
MTLSSVVETSIVQNPASSFDVLMKMYPLHTILARMTSRDGLSFHVLASSEDLRLSLEARIKSEKISIQLPKSHNTIKQYVMEFGAKAQKLLIEVHT